MGAVAPGDVLLAGRPDDELRAALESAASTVVAAAAGAGAVDAVVLVAPTPGELRVGFDALRPGGWLYAELAPPVRRLARRRRPVGPAGARAALRAAGATDVRTVWCWPSFTDALELVPLGGAGPLRASLARRRASRASRLRALAVRTASAAGAFERLAPSVALVGRRVGSGPGAVAADPVAGAIAAAEAEGRLAGLDARRLDRLLLTPRFPASRHVVALLVDDAGRPRLVAKLPRLAADRAAVDAEAAALRALGESAPDAGPRLLHLGGGDGQPVLLEAAVPGRTVRWRDLDGADGPVVARAEALLRRFPRIPAEPGWTERLVGRPLDALAAAAEDPATRERLASLAAATRRAVAPLEGLVPELVLQHGDPLPPNLLEDAGRLAFVDWETADPAGLPLADLALLVAAAATSSAGLAPTDDPARQADAVEVALLRPGSPGRAAIERHAGATGVPARAVDGLLAAAWARLVASLPSRTGRSPGSWILHDRHAVTWARTLRPEAAIPERPATQGEHGR